MDTLQGKLLVASPHLPDPNFYRSVILIVEHQEDGALGLVLNRITNQLIRDVWRGACDQDCVAKDFLRLGGPVEGPLMALHSIAELEGHEIVPKVYFSSERAVLTSLVDQNDRPYHLFSGYSGWGAGQLDNEIKVGGWLTAPANWEHIFGEDEDHLWQRVTNMIGDEITRASLNIRNLPADPRLN